MTSIEASIEIESSAAELWSVVMNPEQLENWVTIHHRLGAVSEVPLKQGSTVEQTLKLAHAHFKVHWTVVELNPPTYAHWSGNGPARSRADTHYEITPISDQLVRFKYRNSFKPPGGPFGALAGRVLIGGISEREAHRSLLQLKEQLEQ